MTRTLASDLTPRLTEAAGCDYPKTNFNRLSPIQGILTSVLSNSTATSNGLCARFWNFTTTSPSPIVTPAEASMKSRNRCRDFADFVTLADPDGQKPVETARHQRQLQVAVDLQSDRRGQRVHVEEVAPVLDVVLDQYPLVVAAAQVRSRPGQLVGQRQGRIFMPKVGDGQLPDRALVIVEDDPPVEETRGLVEAGNAVQFDPSPGQAVGVVATSSSNFLDRRRKVMNWTPIRFTLSRLA